jgi:hypothetical protein
MGFGVVAAVGTEVEVDDPGAGGGGMEPFGGPY